MPFPSIKIAILSTDTKRSQPVFEMLQGAANHHVALFGAEEQVPDDVELLVLDVFDVTELEAVQGKSGAGHVLITSPPEIIPQVAVWACENGCSIIEKPLLKEKLFIELVNCSAVIKAKRAEGIEQQAETQGQSAILGNSEKIVHMRAQIKKAAPTDARILITGKNGTGKELVAEAIHRNSRRSKGPFIKINCAAIPQTLIESELFGHEKGAFTGAVNRKIGLFEEAGDGTLFLDEIGDMAPGMQAKMLRVLQENEFVRIGGIEPIQFDVRIIAATNKDLRQEIRRGTFRSDLFFRLNVIHLAVPSLAERTGDISLLANHFLLKACLAEGKQKHFNNEVLALLEKYAWPGNIRELQNVMERAAIMIESTEITPSHLQNILPDLVQSVLLAGPNSNTGESGQSLREKMEAYEKLLLLEAHKMCKGNISKMARTLHTDRANLHRKLARHKIR